MGISAWALVLSIGAFMISVGAFAWQVTSWRWSGVRVRVEFVTASCSRRQAEEPLVWRWIDGRQSDAEGHAGGSPEQLFGLRVINVGRLPVSVLEVTIDWHAKETDRSKVDRFGPWSPSEEGLRAHLPARLEVAETAWWLVPFELPRRLNTDAPIGDEPEHLWPQIVEPGKWIKGNVRLGNGRLARARVRTNYVERSLSPEFLYRPAAPTPDDFGGAVNQDYWRGEWPEQSSRDRYQ